MKDKSLKIINHYGVNNQQRKFNEEVFELQEAITTYELKKDSKEHIAEEIADCENMLEEFRKYYDIPKTTINRIQLFKQDRQLKRIENEVKE